jgi:hypothetical protein
MISSQQLQRMTEADALGTLHPLDNVSTFATCALAVPLVFHRVDVQAGIGVLVKGAEADQLFAAAPQLNASGLG